jgi:hypothetical protein
MEAVDAFAGVGVDRFFLVYVNLENKGVSHRRDCGIELLRVNMAKILQRAEERRLSVVLKPNAGGVPLFQLDDLDAAIMQTVMPAAFLVLCTSPGSYHAWFAIRDGDKEFWRRLKKKTGADKHAAGASRISGSLNFKPKYAPSYPRVETIHVASGRIVSQADLEALGVVATAEPPSVRKSGGCGSLGSRRPTRFPDYQRCLDGAPDAQSHPGKDRSAADDFWCKLALEWGWSEADVSAELMESSDKAKQKGEAYVRRTVATAAFAVSKKKRTTPPGRESDGKPFAR